MNEGGLYTYYPRASIIKCSFAQNLCKKKKKGKMLDWISEGKTFFLWNITFVRIHMKLRWCVNKVLTHFYTWGPEILVFGSSALTIAFKCDHQCDVLCIKRETWELHHSGLLQLLTLIKPNTQRQRGKMVNFEGRPGPVNCFAPSVYLSVNSVQLYFCKGSHNKSVNSEWM